MLKTVKLSKVSAKLLKKVKGHLLIEAREVRVTDDYAIQEALKKYLEGF